MKRITKSPSRAVALLAVILALTFVTSMLPAVFLLPLIIAAVMFGGMYGFIASCFFAAVSIMYAYLMPVSPAAVSFTLHPWVAIVPRLPLGIAAWLGYKITGRLTRNSDKVFLRDILPINIGASVASLLNTALVVGCLVLFYANESVLDTTVLLSAPYMLIMGVIELAAVNILVPLIVWALRKTPAFKPAKPSFGANSAEQTDETDNGAQQPADANNTKRTDEPEF